MSAVVSSMVFPPVVKQSFLTDHSVASILGPESVSTVTQVPLPVENTLPHEFDAASRSSSLRLTDFCHNLSTSHYRQVKSSLSTLVSPFDHERSKLATSCDKPSINAQPSDEFQTLNSEDRLYNSVDGGGEMTSECTGASVLRPLPTFPGPRSSLPHDGRPQLELESSDLWRQFDELTTEMVITKSGRRMFPAIKFKVTGLDARTKYVFLLDIVPVDNYRYKFQDSRWVVAGKVDENDVTSMLQHRCVYVHPDSPADGQHWMTKTLSFHRLKLTNNTTDSRGHALLNSMHYYQPRVHLVRAGHLASIPFSSIQTFTYPQTRFVAVTAYQNNKITQLKIDNNPFAKGFRLCSSAKMDKRKHEILQVRDSEMELMEYGSSGFQLSSSGTTETDFRDYGYRSPTNDSCERVPREQQLEPESTAVSPSWFNSTPTPGPYTFQSTPSTNSDSEDHRDSRIYWHRAGNGQDQRTWSELRGMQFPMQSSDLYRPKPMRFLPNRGTMATTNWQ